MRQKLCLDGRWRFTPELECRPENNNNLLEEGEVYAQPALCRKDWEWVNVPGVWQRYQEQYRIYEGVCWYCKEIDLPELTVPARARLVFKGVAYRADVYVNGTLAGTHKSSYTEFSVEVGRLLCKGKNLIAVRVDNRALLRIWPCDRGYFGYGGIHRSVWLELMEGTCLENSELTPRFDTKSGEAVLKVAGSVCGDCSNVSVRLAGRTDMLPVDKNGRFSGELRYADLSPWSPESTILYDLSLTACDDSVSYRIGFRSFEKQEGKLCLNGKPYRMKGTCYVYDSPVYGLVMTRDQLVQDLGEMKAAGVNAIRTHYPMDDLFYDLCDEMGFLTWIEPNVYCYKPANEKKNTFFSQPEYIENAKQMVCEMIAPARSHASVVFYGIGNECNLDHPEAEPFFRTLAGLVRELDDSRLIAFAALYGLVGKIGDVIDVIGLNSYYGWYDRVSDLYAHEDLPRQNVSVSYNKPDLTPFHEMLKEVQERIPASVPILLTEFGADSIPGCHSSCADLWSEEYHADIIRDTIRASYQYERINGTFVFCFTDNLDPSKPRNGFWNWQNLKGMLTYERDRKLPFYAMQEMYCE